MLQHWRGGCVHWSTDAKNTVRNVKLYALLKLHWETEKCWVVQYWTTSVCNGDLVLFPVRYGWHF
jgi:hypothetical protein